MELLERLTKVYEALRKQGRIHNQKDFAAMIGANPATISRAFNEDTRYLTIQLVKRAEALLDDVQETKEPEKKGVYIPEETVTLYNNMSESIRILSETIARMQGGINTRPVYPYTTDRK